MNQWESKAQPATSDQCPGTLPSPPTAQPSEGSGASLDVLAVSSDLSIEVFDA